MHAKRDQTPHHYECDTLCLTRLRSSFPVDEALLQALLPLKDVWRHASVRSPVYFASTSLCERTFNELLFCERMCVFVDIRELGEPSQPFMSLRAVRECTSLSIGRPPTPLSAVEIIEWLKADARYSEPKRLGISHWAIRDGVENLVDNLKTVSLGEHSFLELKYGSSFEADLPEHISERHYRFRAEQTLI